MNNTDEPTYVVIITIDIPGAVEPASISVTLHPNDSLQTSVGKVKQLQDCTLGELLQFGDQLEAELWTKYESTTLVDLVIEGEAKVDVNYIEELNEHVPPAELWLEQMIIIPEAEHSSKKATTPDEIETKKITELPDSVMADVDNAIDTEDPDDPIEKLADPIVDLGELTDEEEVIEAEESGAKDSGVEAFDEETGGELETTVNEEAPSTETAEEIPSVTVAESELVHEEREAEPEPAAVDAIVKPEIPRVQILGRRRPIGHTTWTAVDILINEPAFRDAQAHSISSPDREVAGVLVGPPPEKQPDGRYVVHISDTIIAKYTRMHGASVTYTPESWRYMSDKLAEKYPDGEAMIVGWYHTHPGFGIFLSGMDRFIHQNFFTQIWHVALVLDPLARRSGFFCWDRNLSKVDPYEFPWPKWADNSW